jgi:hypothetical protein
MAVKKIRKQVLKTGKWFYEDAPNGVLNFTSDYLKQLAENFKRSPHAPVLRSHVDNQTAERNPHLIVSKNIDVLEFADNALWAEFSADEKELEKYNDVSVAIEPVEDHKSGEFIGDVVKHIALVLNPYIKTLDTFQQLGEKENNYLILLSEITMQDEKEKVETTEEVKQEETAETVAEAEAETEVEAKDESTADVITEKTDDVTEEKSEEDKSSDAIRAQLSEKESENRALRAKLVKLEAEANYNKLLKEGKVLPSFKTEFIALTEAVSNSTEVIELSDGKQKTTKELLESMLSKMPVLINLTEKGVNTEDGSKVPGIGVSLSLTEKMREGFQVQNPQGTEEDFQAYLVKNADIIKTFDK